MQILHGGLSPGDCHSGDFYLRERQETFQKLEHGLLLQQYSHQGQRAVGLREVRTLRFQMSVLGEAERENAGNCRIYGESEMSRLEMLIGDTPVQVEWENNDSVNVLKERATMGNIIQEDHIILLTRRSI